MQVGPSSGNGHQPPNVAARPPTAPPGPVLSMAKQNESDTSPGLMPGKHCRVSFKDLDGIRHAVEVEADSLYEAPVPRLKPLKRSDWVEIIGAGTRIDIGVLAPPVQHGTVSLRSFST